MQTTEIKPIINGSVNPRLTPELFKTLNPGTKRSVIWNVLVSMQYPHTYQDIDGDVFKAPQYSIDYKDIEAEVEGLDELFDKVKKERETHYNLMRALTASHRFELGKRIYEMQKELNFGGMLTLDIDRLRGYIKACGSWNGFKAPEVNLALCELDTLAPRTDYGPNNPNTGNIMHKWKTVHGCEYIIMEFDFIDAQTLERVKEFYKTQWVPKGQRIKADSVRFEETSHGNNYFGIELIMWWD